MKRFIKLLSLILTLCTLCGAAVSCNETPGDTSDTEDTAKDTTQAPAETEEASTKAPEKEENNEEFEDEEKEDSTVILPLEKNKTYKILFIGNSYIHYNSTVPTEFKKIASSAGYTVEVTSITKGAWTLEQFADPTDSMGKKVNDALATKQYDYVFMQEQSHTPVTNPEKFYNGAEKLAAKIRDAGAEPVFYCTWGRKNGNGDIAKFGLVDNETMTWNLAAAYRKMGIDLDAPVAYVGHVFYDLYTKTDINVYHTDGSHPSTVGTYTAALTLFCTLFRVSADEVTYDFELDESVFSTIKGYVNNAAVEPPAIPDKYLDAYGIM